MGIGRSDATMTKANSGTVVDCAEYYAVRRVAWLSRMHLGISRRKKHVLAFSALLALLAARLTELVIACVLTVVSARDHDLLQAIWLAAARYVTSGQDLVVTGCKFLGIVGKSEDNATGRGKDDKGGNKPGQQEGIKAA